MTSSDDIRRVRESLKETQADFGRRFGVDQSTIHRWETDGPPTRGTARIALDHIIGSLGPVADKSQASASAA